MQAFNRHEEAVAIALEGAEQARRHGLDRACGAFLRINAGVSLYELGRWDEMEEQLREADAIEAAGVDELALRARVGDPVRGSRTVRRGRGARSNGAVRCCRGSTNAEVLLEFAMVEARVRAWSGDRAAASSSRSMRSRNGSVASSCSDAGPALLAVAAAVSEDDAAIAAVGRDARPLGRRVPVGRRRTGRRAVDRAPRSPPSSHRTDPDVWRAVADAWAARAPRIPNATYARFREAGAHVAVGDRRAAEEPRAMRTRWRPPSASLPIAQRIEALARQANLDLGTSGGARLGGRARRAHRPRASRCWRSSREGRTNRQIAEELFITTKTASVHVSNILAKLQVANRGEAAAAARRLGLDR